MKKFRERTFLFRLLALVFFSQFIYLGYQIVGCNNTNSKDLDVCKNAGDLYLKTGGSAIATILALLVKSPESDSELEQHDLPSKEKVEPTPEPKFPEKEPPVKEIW